MLTDYGHDAATYELAGPKRLGLSTMIATVAQVTGRSLRTRNLGRANGARSSEAPPRPTR